MPNKLRIMIWNENVEEKRKPEVLEIYPEGIHGALAAAFEDANDIAVSVATMDQADCGLTEAALNQTDVIVW